ncbi:hypothetical protein A3B21_00180 [Candidatus Uhrbacteria bacterium RIFCSPLOWO2_01_FULL_47_24]|uniref:Heparinase II/III-like C-terminal domain-containing protein n=1 Tax=Candidatus Uhrbacteria bacterium RIFCSPLOWO2_01_FULL_47_24 TaxID=1802401 RepID=A0A1F7UUE4_9BACT|nr:MAG: hypothetical protein A3D58_01555 [Candidatus Uhrbacteria bacterium RIFCSPHIGHO2_02_FULL_46_47]OGL81328.1 MAG: hypothetical protein A3B21_00180 [Candidatus Uhrbacteria bacterium RIFCSPLOWO2_01_FULL_47_24]OGL83928.1 MAG: hypothetical protein A3J03_00725 [Candidatus Uhrbacteria bacterium RIFCSPLOWO2_02_FULL_46_25]
MNYEVRNLLYRCINPLLLEEGIYFIVRRFLFSLQYRYLPSRWYYPKNVRGQFRKLPPLPEGGLGGVGGQAHNPSSPPLEKGREMVLKLAVGFLEYEGEPDWQKQFDDPEQTMSLHRWHWLIYEDMDIAQGIALIRSWLTEMGAVPKGVAGTTYTTGERIVNALLFLAPYPRPLPQGEREIQGNSPPLLGGVRGGGQKIPEDIRDALREMAYHVARHLEYHGTRGTGNHVVNNARALFFAGQMLKVKELSDLALVIIKEALPWLVTKEGFLREESSHYHLLFTRWIMEMYELAKTTDHYEMEIFLAPWVKQLAAQCWFFLVQDKQGGWQIPLVGDISPDCTPEWLLHYLVPCIFPYKPDTEEQGMQAYRESGWFRLNHGVHTLFWHIPQACMIHRASHGHADACSFVFFASGVLVVIDPGRPTYKASDPLHIYSGGVSAHTSLTIDSFGPFPYDRAQKLPAFYQKREVFTQWQKTGDQFVFSISHTGFLRIQGDMIKHTRHFKVRCNRPAFEVDDELYGTRAHAVETFFHFASGIEGIHSQHSTGVYKTISDWTCPAYGVMIPSLTTKVSCETIFPCTMTHRFSW